MFCCVAQLVWKQERLVYCASECKFHYQFGVFFCCVSFVVLVCLVCFVVLSGFFLCFFVGCFVIFLFAYLKLLFEGMGLEV